VPGRCREHAVCTPRSLIEGHQCWGDSQLWLGPASTRGGNDGGVRAATLRLSNGLKSTLWDYPEVQMKFIVAALSVLVLVAISGSLVALVMGAGGYLPDVSMTPLTDTPK
jgi:hypothetical protein